MTRIITESALAQSILRFCGFFRFIQGFGAERQRIGTAQGDIGTFDNS
ncbi:MAG: hypothetical protein LBF89_09540 [Bacteroidales bacterium]|jgi:hypothetical protein|nr:hypothetical protein [Bacteroidales bacterium]